VLAAVVTGCAGRPLPPGVEAVTPLERELRTSELPVAGDARRLSQLDEARRRHEAEPGSEEAAIWHGRRLGYVGRMREAIAVYSGALKEHPGSYRLLRHRGHRYISVREFGHAVRDLERAWALAQRSPDAVEPDRDPNPSGTPRSTDRSNILYHWGLALYLSGRFGESERVFARRDGLADYNDDMLVSTTHWRYLCLARLGRSDQARRVLDPIGERMDIRENEGYHRLCLMYKGLLTPEQCLSRASGGAPADLSVAYGVGAFLMARGRAEEGERLLREIVAGSSWFSFGMIAAEADLARLGAGGR
jgi:tetratricopeptide (TPR) repeat protein